MTKNIHFARSLWVLVGASILTWILLVWLWGLDHANFIQMLKQVPNAITIITIGTVFFIKWLWKLPVFKHWLVCIPNLNGTWVGEIQSTWVDPKSNKSPPPIKVMLTIKQSLFCISCVMQTAEMKSYSSAEGFQIDPERQINQLAYIYTSKPGQLVQHRSPSHDGAIIFDILTITKKLVGEYWTGRKTTGTIDLKFYSKAILEEMPSFTKDPS